MSNVLGMLLELRMRPAARRGGCTEGRMRAVSGRLCPARITRSGAAVAARTAACRSWRGWRAGGGQLQAERENLVAR